MPISSNIIVYLIEHTENEIFVKKDVAFDTQQQRIGLYVVTGTLNLHDRKM